MGDMGSERRELAGGFTLVELLVVVAAIALLMALLVPTLGQARARARGAACASQLRQIGLLQAQTVSSERGQFFLYSPVDQNPPKTWAKVLWQDSGSEVDPSLFVCPSYAPYQFNDDWKNTYGVRRDPPETATLVKGLLEHYLVTDQIRSPASYVHIADTTSGGAGGYDARQYHLFEAAGTEQVHARHANRANILFLDGHVESCTRARLEELGITALYGVDEEGGYF